MKRIRIIDYGHRKNITDGKLNTPCDSPGYASPKMIKNEQYCGMKSDIWSLGIELFTMIIGSLLFKDKNDDVLSEKIVNREVKFKSNNFSNEVKDLIFILMLEKFPSSRITYDTIVSNSVYKQRRDQYLLLINEKKTILDISLNEIIAYFDNSLHNNQMKSILDKVIKTLESEYLFPVSSIQQILCNYKPHEITTHFRLLCNKLIK